MRSRIVLFVLALSLLVHGLALQAGAQPDFIAFETGHVRPMAISGNTLVAVNTADNHLEVFTLKPLGITKRASVPVGLEPCSVAIDGQNRAWVVNHLSDSVSIVDLTTLSVVRTLLVGDEPRDIVLTDHDGAGGDEPRAFITTAHRGQHRTDSSISGVTGAGDPQLTTAGVDRADVWVFDVTDPGPAFGGTPLKIVELFGDTPRALAVSNDGGTVYAAVFHSGNQTAVVTEGMVPDDFDAQNCMPADDCNGDGVTSPNGLGSGRLPGGNPGPSANHETWSAPEVGLVVQYDNPSGEWRDEDGRNWSNGIRFFLPDVDIFEIDAGTLNETANHAHVGTILFNMVVNPNNDKLYVSNTDAQNLTRFEGPGTTGGSTVQGNLHQSRITVIDGSTVTPRHLNSHINYATLPAPAGIKDHSLATPLQMVVSSDGSTLYVAAFGSSMVGVIPTAGLESGSFDPTVESANYLPVSGGGPSGLALDEGNQILYVMTRFNNSIAVVDLQTGSELSSHPLNNPEPPNVVDGRPFLYDAFATSSNGEASCSSCHVFGDFDSLAWDLGNPDDDVKFNTQTINLFVTQIAQPFPGLNGTGITTHLHPMKGPMTTQTLRGMVNSGHMHWRGDRGSGFCGTDRPEGTDSELSFKNFIVAFEGLVGDDQAIAAGDCNGAGFMQRFTDFMLDVQLPPNPVRALNNQLTIAQDAGKEFYLGNVGPDSGDGDGHRSDGTQDLFGFTLGFTCEGCHRLDASQGFFGTGGQASFEGEPQILKIPHLRNTYQKVGMFGMPDADFFLPGGDNSHQGDQVRGTGFLHDGSTDSMFRFFLADVFSEDFAGTNIGFFGNNAQQQEQREDMEQFMLAFDSDLAPIVGQQITLTSTNLVDVLPRIQLLEQRAGASFTSEILDGTVTECDLVARGRSPNGFQGWLYRPGTDDYVSDWGADPDSPYTPAALRVLASTVLQELTFTCVPPGSGERVARDRDGDGAMNFDEQLAGTDPHNSGSVLGACNDGIDNDGDGLIDLADGGCGGNAASSIENPQCNDGYDNEADGLVDFGSDPNCSSTADNREAPNQCGLGAELAFVLVPLMLVRKRRGRARQA